MPLPRRFMALAAFGAMLPALSFASPPPDARPASDMLRLVEQRPDFASLREMEWDQDGYWEIEYVTRDGAVRKLRLDPRTGQPSPR